MVKLDSKKGAIPAKDSSVPMFLPILRIDIICTFMLSLSTIIPILMSIRFLFCRL